MEWIQRSCYSKMLRTYPCQSSSNLCRHDVFLLEPEAALISCYKCSWCISSPCWIDSCWIDSCWIACCWIANQFVPLFPHVSYSQPEGGFWSLASSCSSYWQKLCHLVWMIRGSLAVETSESWHQTDKTATISEYGDENADVASLHLQTVEN